MLVSGTRRHFLKLATTALAAVPLSLKRQEALAATPSAPAPSDPGVVRVASVTTAVEGGVLPDLAEAFHQDSGLKVTFYSGQDPYGEAEAGRADMVISHFGHRGTEDFVQRGLGLWPRTVFSNQLGLFGAPADPAKVQGLPSLVQAFRQIAEAKAPFVVNGSLGLRYLTETVWYAAGQPSKVGWFLDPGVNGKEAISFAAERGAYVFWGLTPFTREQKATPHGLAALVTADPMLQRLMVSVVTKADRVPGVNAAGAIKFQDYLLRPLVQARMLDVHYPGIEQAVWAPAGRHNSAAVLPE